MDDLTSLMKALDELDSDTGGEWVRVTRCRDCKLWDKDTIRHQSNDFRSWDEAECEWLASRDGYNEIDHYMESDDFCSNAERREDD